ncbi:zinc-binding dehydrogenase [Acidimicrobiia bacterium]|jgi:NADPH2:quinone reductase|nr:zinc-binding dehydrogenase [Acidimicrobiia bacterium]MDC1071008.1 zinc-binding dehydrogenase [Acidimicrobiia bacterium]|tara:strand:+ start:180 stop:1316 length:1137 start_codon:yes stop_codon:yes gene_type:complete
MTNTYSKEIRSTVTSDGVIEITIGKVDVPIPADDEVLVEIHAAPINPSDIGLLTTFAGDLSNIDISGSGEDLVASMKIHPALMSSMKSRLDQSMTVGNEGAGIVIDAGENAKKLIGKTVGFAAGSMYSQYRCVPAINCLVMEEGTTPRVAASSFVNPLTALCFVETMKMENHSAIVHTAAASNLGQMLVKICKDDEIPLVNIVRKQEQVDILKNIGAEYICNTSDPDFMKNLVKAVLETGATLGFDATGGGNNGELPSQILSAMEIAANQKSEEYSRYGSETYKQVYIYGGLDQSPTILKRSYGMSWGLGGWLLTPMLGKIGMDKFQTMRARIAKEIKTTFASTYIQEISLEEMLQPEVINAYAKHKTGNKYLVNPQK